MVTTSNPEYSVTYTSGAFTPDAKHLVAVGQSKQSRGNTYLWEWESGKLIKMFNHTGKKIESISWHPKGLYIAHAGDDPYIYICRAKDILEFPNDNIPVAHKVWAGENSEYIDFNADGSFLLSAHQNGLIKLWIWMSEYPILNQKRHSWVKVYQRDANK